jgi:hypothetical protein
LCTLHLLVKLANTIRTTGLQMAAKINRHGLSRSIPEEVKRRVRQRCGFGCVVCGDPFITYEHFNPPFKDAEEHREDGITLLCGGCQDKTAKRLMSKETVARHNANPKALVGNAVCNVEILGFRREICPIIYMGNNQFFCDGEVIRVFGTTVFGFELDEGPRAGLLLNMRINDREGCALFEVVRNELIVSNSNWDARWDGNKLTIRRGNQKILFSMRLHLPHVMRIDRIDLVSSGARLKIQISRIIVEFPAKDGERRGGQQVIDGCVIDGAPGALLVEESGRVGLGIRTHERFDLPTSLSDATR